jgi:hypothetical protein
MLLHLRKRVRFNRSNHDALQDGLYVLPVVIKSVPLGQLRIEVHEMAGEKKIVLWGDC